MKLNKRNLKTIGHIVGWAIGIAALYFSLTSVKWSSVRHALETMQTVWIYPIIIGNFVVIVVKALRWQITIRPIKVVPLWMVFKILTIGFMANNILPARLGDVLRIHLLGKNADVSRVSTTTTAIADRIFEGISFIFIAAILVIFVDVPKWMETGLIITLLITIALYTLFLIYSTRKIEHPFFKKLQDGAQSLRQPKIVLLGLTTSMISWALQGLLIYFTQLAFGVTVPIWGIILVLVAINLAIAIPSTPSHVGTFEFACILAYTFLGVDKNVGLLVAVTFHLLQVLPVTLVGGALFLSSTVKSGRNTPCAEGLDTPC